jgi:hypothetical protein
VEAGEELAVEVGEVLKARPVADVGDGEVGFLKEPAGFAEPHVDEHAGEGAPRDAEEEPAEGCRAEACIARNGGLSDGFVEVCGEVPVDTVDAGFRVGMRLRRGGGMGGARGEDGGGAGGGKEGKDFEEEQEAAGALCGEE